VIVVVGSPAWRAAEPAGPDGRACRVALAAAERGGAVELIGRAGDDPAGDALLLALARAHVGHVALLRDPARATPIVDAVADEESVSPIEDGVSAATPGRAASGPVLEPADVSLAMRYLPSYDVIVVTDDVPADALPVVVEAAEFGGARLVVLVGEGSAPPDGLPEAALVLEAPSDDPDGAFAALVGGYAAALDAGSTPEEAFVAARGNAWERPVA
jgi:sugar/nucleoside kinase (ribokinase family)